MTDFDLKDSDLYHDYCDRPQAWRFEHVTQPRKSWMDAGKKRRYAPPPEIRPVMAGRFYKAGERHDDYDHIYMNNAGNWYGMYIVAGKRHHTPAKSTPFGAAVAYNKTIVAEGLPARYLIDLGLDAGEQAS